MAVVASLAVVLKEATGLVTKTKGHIKVAEKGHWMLVVATLIMHQIGATKVCMRVHQTQRVQVMQCFHRLLRAEVADLVSPATMIAAK